MKLKKYKEFSVNEELGLLMKGNHTYEMVTMDGDLGKIVVKVNDEGILISENHHLSWDQIDGLENKYKK